MLPFFVTGVTLPNTSLCSFVMSAVPVIPTDEVVADEQIAVKATKQGTNRKIATDPDWRAFMATRGGENVTAEEWAEIRQALKERDYNRVFKVVYNHFNFPSPLEQEASQCEECGMFGHIAEICGNSFE